jgi:hypothetical protein
MHVDTIVDPSDLLPRCLFTPAAYADLQQGDRVQLPRLYHGVFIDWWWRILTVDHVDWITTTQPGQRSLMLWLTEALPCGDRFVLVAGRESVAFGVRRVVGVIPPRITLDQTETQTRKEQQ